jgi:hypothetical protein
MDNPFRSRISVGWSGALELLLLVILVCSMQAQNASIKPVAVVPCRANTPFWVEVRVGEPNAVTNLYGINFKLKSSTTTCSYVDGSAIKGDVLGASPLTFFQGIDAQTVDMAVSKTAAPGVNGSGVIAKAQFVSSVAGSVMFSLNDVTANDPAGTAIPFSAVTASVTITDVPLEGALPTDFELGQNFPNPFNPTTRIRYATPFRSFVMLTVFNTLGQQVGRLVSGDIEGGYHEVEFNGSGLTSGVYFYTLQSGHFVRTKTLVLIR